MGRSRWICIRKGLRMRPSRVSVLVLLCAATTLSSAIPKPAEGEHKSSANRIQEKDLSDQQHFEKEEHNPDYDHEAFLGEDARTFDELNPEESKERLGLIYDKIDSNKDSYVSEEELVSWIKHVQNRYIEKDTDRQWGEFDATDVLDWAAYKKRTYGFDDDETSEMEDGSYDYKDMIRRDKRRWKKADGDGDEKLTKEEFSHFLHPEEADHMREIVIEETLEDIDRNKDGFIDLEEYIDDMYDEDDDQEFEPEWVKEERDDFIGSRDKNSDGVMDREEVKEWIYPSEEANYAAEEAKHLLLNADGNEDGQLDKEEVLNKYDLFVGSQATDFGEALSRHDEF